MSPTIRSASVPTEVRDYRSTTPLHMGCKEQRIQKHRKMSSTGGGRAWTEEEDAYLIRTRLHKMPYKHIAAHLQKTELACRLHYHQMSYGSNRRRRTESVSSVNSLSALSTTQECPLEYKASIHMSTPMCPPSPQSVIHSRASSVDDSPRQSRSHVSILPKPNTSTLHSMQSTPANLNRSIRLDTGFSQSHDDRASSFENPEHIDTIRLRGLYDTYRDSFWSLIASDYSKGLSFPIAKLEEAFFHAIFKSYGSRATSPPTPNFSPQDASELQKATYNTPVVSSDSRFHAINGPISSAITGLSNPINGPSPVEKCAVASLLTIEKDVWALKRVTTI
ncbi:hypothetical protein ACJ72_00669 [Emergomyces africanus]|uniref:Myb-like domain-containing protein n=1 Tax=Emergomyces africanus TaxID=1955775 RepID=A0A1B7P7D6_9EURO|nr:hypothetical protein ACJ72_00669 [Emergomyces africanus]